MKPIGILSFVGTVADARKWIQVLKRLHEEGILVDYYPRINQIYIGGIVQ